MSRVKSLKAMAILFCSCAWVDANAVPPKAELETHYAHVAEFSGFPYIVDFIAKEKQYSRQEVLKLAADESAALAKDPDGQKPLWADVSENHLSHLLSWMSASTTLPLQAMAIYNRQGLLMGVAPKTMHAGKVVDFKAWDQLMTLFPLALDDETLNQLEAAIKPKEAPATAEFMLVRENVSKKNPAWVQEFLDIRNSQGDVVGFMVYLVARKK